MNILVLMCFATFGIQGSTLQEAEPLIVTNFFGGRVELLSAERKPAWRSVVADPDRHALVLHDSQHVGVWNASDLTTIGSIALTAGGLPPDTSKPSVANRTITAQIGEHVVSVLTSDMSFALEPSHVRGSGFVEARLIANRALLVVTREQAYVVAPVPNAAPKILGDSSRFISDATGSVWRYGYSPQLKGKFYAYTAIDPIASSPNQSSASSIRLSGQHIPLFITKNAVYSIRLSRGHMGELLVKTNRLSGTQSTIADPVADAYVGIGPTLKWLGH